MLLEEGQIVNSIYEVEFPLGEGAFAEVYRVKHRFLGHQAMKVFKIPEISLQEIEEMLSEAVLLSKINHPNIIRVFEAGIMETRLGKCGFFTMEYVPGGTLETYRCSNRFSFIPLPQVKEIVKQICQGMARAHEEQPPIIHRDLKPQNILIGYEDAGMRVRVSDFGLAKRVNPLTLLASAHGTIAFKPPEVLANLDSCAGDVWAIGTMLYLLVTDRYPYTFQDVDYFLAGKCWEQPMVPASKLNPLVRPQLDVILSRALALNHADRYSNAVELLASLEQWDPSLEYFPADIDEKQEKPPPSGGETLIRQKLDEAKRLSLIPGRLNEAADILEELLGSRPEIREQYQYYLTLWRRGIIM